MSPKTMPSAPSARPANLGGPASWGAEVWLGPGIASPESTPKNTPENTSTPSLRARSAPSVGRHHLLGLHVLVEVLGLDQPELGGGLPQRDVLLVGELRDLRRVVVADHLVEGRDEHQRVLDVTRDHVAVRLDPDDAVVEEAVARIGQQAAALEHVVHDDRL